MSDVDWTVFNCSAYQFISYYLMSSLKLVSDLCSFVDDFRSGRKWPFDKFDKRAIGTQLICRSNTGISYQCFFRDASNMQPRVQSWRSLQLLCVWRIKRKTAPSYLPPSSGTYDFVISKYQTVYLIENFKSKIGVP